MIEVSHLIKKFGSKKAVDDISFTVNEGEILGFLGPNGAGKSTTMNIITGYLSASSGSVKIGGYDILDNPMEVKKQIGYLPEQPPLYLDLTVKEYLEFVFDLKKCKYEKKPHLAEICEVVNIDGVYKRLINNLSKGYRQRVGLAGALIGAPAVLILDEPTIGLDPKEIIEIRNLIKRLGKKRTVILSSHILTEVQAVCDRVIVINEGRIIADGTPNDLSKNVDDVIRFSIRIEAPQDIAMDIIMGIEGVKTCNPLAIVEEGTCDFIIDAEASIDIRKPLTIALAKEGYIILALKTLDMSLEEAFIKLIELDKTNNEENVLEENETCVSEISEEIEQENNEIIEQENIEIDQQDNNEIKEQDDIETIEENKNDGGEN